MFTSAFNKVDDKERFMLQFLEYQSKESRDILCSLSRSEPTRKRDLSPPDQRSGHKRKRTSDDNDGARKIQSFGSFEFLGTRKIYSHIKVITVLMLVKILAPLESSAKLGILHCLLSQLNVSFHSSSTSLRDPHL